MRKPDSESASKSEAPSRTSSASKTGIYELKRCRACHTSRRRRVCGSGSGRRAGVGLDELVHGSTVATNAVIERRGAKVAMVFTRGFRDVLLIQRQDRLRSYDPAYQRPRPIVERRACFEVTERILSDGTVAEALDEEAVLLESRSGHPRRRIRGGGYLPVECLPQSGARGTPRRVIDASAQGRGARSFVHDSCASFASTNGHQRLPLRRRCQPVIDAYVGRMHAWLEQRQFAGRLTPDAIQWRNPPRRRPASVTIR